MDEKTEILVYHKLILGTKSHQVLPLIFGAKSLVNLAHILKVGGVFDSAILTFKLRYTKLKVTRS